MPPRFGRAAGDERQRSPPLLLALDQMRRRYDMPVLNRPLGLSALDMLERRLRHQHVDDPIIEADCVASNVTGVRLVQLHLLGAMCINEVQVYAR